MPDQLTTREFATTEELSDYITSALEAGGFVDVSLPEPLTLPDGDVTLADGLVLLRTDCPMRSPAYTQHRCYRSRDGLHVIAGLEPTHGHEWGNLLHVSFSRPRVLPNWREVKLIKAAFFGPDRHAMVVLPKESEYVNMHPFTHHLWEMPEAWNE